MSKSKKPTTHGGPRKGAGRPKGKKNANAKGRTAVTRSVSMPAEVWRDFDIQRGTMSRGKFIAWLL
jgi:hypothetical protein